MDKKINALLQLADYLRAPLTDELDAIMTRTTIENQWFTRENQLIALDAIANHFLDEQQLRGWLSRYDFSENDQNYSENTPLKTVGIVMAGNLPLVGFHDFLCVFVSGCRAVIKLSDKDKRLLPFLVQKLTEYYPEMANLVVFQDNLKEIDALIATGSTNTSRYFDYYFSKIPHIIRKNRTSVAVLRGSETEEEFHQLGIDIFRYFGLGCRNVAKLYVPRGYDFNLLLEKLHDFNSLVLHHKYKNNFDYNFTLTILNKVPHLSNGCTILVEEKVLHSRIAMLHYEYYDALEEVQTAITAQYDAIQCVVGNVKLADIEVLPFGKTQQPELWDYADRMDTMAWLNELR